MNCLKNNRGLSLIEIMVALGILGVIGAIAVPQFTKYRRTAIYTAVGESLNNVARSAAVCIAANGYAGCNSLSKINMPQLEGGQASTGQTALCVDTVQTIAGEEFKACVSINGSGTSTTTTNKRFCYTDDDSTTGTDSDGNTFTCGSGHKQGYIDGDTATNACNETLAITNGPCVGQADCKATETCQTAAEAANGDCNTGTGVCS